MKTLADWRTDTKPEAVETVTPVSQDEFVEIAMKYFAANLKGNMKTYHEYRNAALTESVESSRYSIEVNFRTTKDEMLDAYAKIALGYVSAAMKNHGLHTKHVFNEKPVRLLVSSRNWDDGEWCGCVTWNHEHDCFVISKGFFNKERKTVSLQHSNKCQGNTPADVSKELYNLMHSLKGVPDVHAEKLKPVGLKRGPKR